MRRSNGSILIVVLFVLVVISTAALSFAYRAGMESRIVRDRAVRVRLGAHVRSAMAIAVARLAANNNDWDHPAEPWGMRQPLSAESWLPDWSKTNADGSAVYATTCRVEDESGKLHVQYASSEDMEALGMSTEQIESLFDWIDSDDVMRAEGAEREYYRSYGDVVRCKNTSVEVLDELFRIRGFSADAYYGCGNAFEGYSARYGEESPLGLVSLLTCVSDGRINPNTAPAEILNTLPLSETAVDQILAFRTYDQLSGGELEEHVFRSEEDVDQLQGLTDTDREVLKASCTYRSDVFRVFVRSVHLSTKLERREECLVRLTEQGPQILQYKAVQQ